MKRARLRGLQDYLALVVRRRGWVIVTFVALSALTVLIAMLFPKLYLSETMILIQPRDVPTDFVKDLIAGGTDERLSAIEQTILSRTNLLKILNEFEDRMPGYRGHNNESKVLKLKKRIQIDFSAERRNGVYIPTTNFRISYRDQDPELAQEITARLASLFIEQDSRARESQVFGTTEFLSAELKKVADHLKQSEDALKTLKERFRYELPAELETNLRTLDRLQLQKTSNLEALDRLLSMQMTHEWQISETPPVLARESAATAAATGTQPRNPRVDEYRRREKEYKDLLLKATPLHPDVQRLKAELEQLRKEIPAEELAAPEPAPSGREAPGTVPNPVYQGLTAQLREVNTEIEIRQKEKKSIEDEMALYTERIKNTPGVEQEMAAALRANADLTKQHEELRVKVEQAKLAESLENHQRGAQFVIVDPANYPLEPITPAARVIILIGLAISLAAAVAAAWIVDGLKPIVWTHRELERLLESSVLVEIPKLVSTADLVRTRRKRLAQAVVFILCAGAYAGGLYYLYLKQTALLRVLDPLIERITERIIS